MATTVTTPAAHRGQLVRAVTASAIGTTIEWYDFFLYGVAAATVFPKRFFPDSDPTVGILLAFSLGFVTHWAANPIPWQLHHLLAVVPILVGIALQMRALSLLLDLDSLRRPIYERANRIFMAGIILTACGVGLAILLDVFEVSARSALVGA